MFLPFREETLFQGLRPLCCIPSFPDLCCILFSLVFPGNSIHHSFFCSVTSGSGDRPRNEGCPGGGVHSFFLWPLAIFQKTLCLLEPWGVWKRQLLKGHAWNLLAIEDFKWIPWHPVLHYTFNSAISEQSEYLAHCAVLASLSLWNCLEKALNIDISRKKHSELSGMGDSRKSIRANHSQLKPYFYSANRPIADSRESGTSEKLQETTKNLRSTGSGIS